MPRLRIDPAVSSRFPQYTAAVVYAFDRENPVEIVERAAADLPAILRRISPNVRLETETLGSRT
ncbi:MAG TPA: hypothetical protein VFL12_13275 [Thermoanaerobaculia bacterium]|nr:hypothetical protein [Thermoanaerobaculia bacterium]